MTRLEIKQEINKALDQIPEELLADILDLINEVQSETKSKVTLISNLKKILVEDSDLLQKLAK